MKTIWDFIQTLTWLTVKKLVFFLPSIGLTLLLCVIIAATLRISGIEIRHSMEDLNVILIVLGLVWLYIACFVLIVLETRAYLDCCFIWAPFREHVHHIGLMRNIAYAVTALLWPLTLPIVVGNYNRMGLTWTDTAMRSLSFWLMRKEGEEPALVFIVTHIVFSASDKTKAHSDDRNADLDPKS
jgi:hypothetical protein